MLTEEYLNRCKPENIRLIDFSFSGANFAGKYFINLKISEEEQIITLIHELLHDLPKYKGQCTLMNPNFDLHTQLEKEAIDIYHNNAHIRNYILEQLRLAKVDPRNCT